MTAPERVDFVVSRRDLRDTEFLISPPAELRPGEALLEIEKFGLTANNITYATLGEAMRYWEFFPAPAGRGRVPVWGFARVAASASDGIAEDEWVFGYLPMSTHLVVTPGRVTDAGFVDVAAHRAALPAVYQRYARLPPGAPREDQDALWRPLFMTSFGAADFLADQDVFGARRAVISSASSKTGMGIAFLLARAGTEVVGLTSRANVGFCERAGYYGRVLSYDAIAELPTEEPLVFVDLAGNEQLAEELRAHAGNQLNRTVVVGATHWQARAGEPLPVGPDADFFFLPPWMERRRHEWGPGGFAQRYDEAWRAFLPSVLRWMTVAHRHGRADVEAVYREVLEGSADPAVGHMLSLV